MEKSCLCAGMHDFLNFKKKKNLKAPLNCLKWLSRLPLCSLSVATCMTLEAYNYSSFVLLFLKHTKHPVFVSLA